MGDNREQAAFAKPKTVLTIGLDPELIDVSSSAFEGNSVSAETIRGGLKAGEDKLNGLGHDAETLLIDFGETAEAVVRARLVGKAYDCIVIGAGIRTLPEHFLLFERLINLIHQAAPLARIAFNTNPADTAEAAQRWV